MSVSWSGGRRPGAVPPASSAVIRFNYPTWTGVAGAWESRHAWADWSGHLGGHDEAGQARFSRTGGPLLDSPGQDRATVQELCDRAGVPYEDWDAATIRERLPVLDTGRHCPPKAITDEAFFDEPTGDLSGCWTPDCGFVDDPQLAAHNLMAAAVRHGAAFRFRTTVTGITAHDRVTGVGLADGTRLSAPVVVNAAGPHSGAVNQLAGVGDDFAVTTRPLRQEVHEVRAPDGYGRGGRRLLVADPDLGTYVRTTPSGGLVVGGTEPRCDRRTGSTIPTTVPRSRPERSTTPSSTAPPAVSPPSRCPTPHGESPVCTTSPTTGSRSTTRPPCRATTSRSAPAGTSSRTPPWSDCS
ncbi:FAD-dependent oxidoreductase [Streptomyces sp. NPDC055966]|uniref:NAD(P)/FAD-dependent oxidoreductase n=1 Tax=Streptomyces sp. NPDC055966 TaxID=3345669 RepID=UPI0035E17332